MFTVFTKNVGGRSSDMYFESFANAEKYLLWDIESCEKIGFKVIRKNIGFNASKGFGFYDIFGKTETGETVIWSLVESYFQDHLANIVDALRAKNKS